MTGPQNRIGPQLMTRRGSCHLRFWMVFSLAVCVLVSGCATAPIAKKAEEVDLSDLCEEYGASWNLDSVSQVLTIWKGQRKVMALIGSDVVLLGDEKIFLSQPLDRAQQAIIVPRDFREKVMERLSAAPVEKAARPFKVIVDCGHGGSDPGAIGRKGTKEKEIVLDIAKRLRDKLQESGIKVIMTRDRDESVSLEKRTEITSKNSADLFVSIHANSEPSHRATGIEVYSCQYLGRKEKKEDQRRKNHRLMFSSLEMKRNDEDLEKIVESLLDKHKTSASPALAAIIGRELSRDLKVRNRGSMKSKFFVVRNNLIPAVLVEVGFLSNTSEEKLLKKSSYRQTIAESLARSIKAYLNS